MRLASSLSFTWLADFISISNSFSPQIHIILFSIRFWTKSFPQKIVSRVVTSAPAPKEKWIVKKKQVFSSPSSAGVASKEMNTESIFKNFFPEFIIVLFE